MQEPTRKIAIAYGRRDLPKLLEALASPCSDEETLQCLHAMSAILNSQEQKAHAIKLGTVPLVIEQLHSSNQQVALKACEALTKLMAFMAGRDELAAAGGIDALASHLHAQPVPVAQCLSQVSLTLEGARMILNSKASVIAGLADACQVSSHHSHFVHLGHTSRRLHYDAHSHGSYSTATL